MTDQTPIEGTVELTADLSALSDEQTARAEALVVARATLTIDHQTTVMGTVGIGHKTSLPKRFSSQDVIDVAEYVVSGTDPMEAYLAREPRTAESDDEQERRRQHDERVRLTQEFLTAALMGFNLDAQALAADITQGLDSAGLIL
jgi:hypothetical protein